MKALKFLSYLLLLFALSCKAQDVGKITSKVGTTGGTASTVAKSKYTTTLEEEISKFVGAINKSYSFPVQIGEINYLAAVSHKDKEVLFAYQFISNFNSLSPKETEKAEQLANTDIHNYHRFQCQNKITYDNLLAKGALFRYEFYSADEILIQSKTLNASDCHR